MDPYVPSKVMIHLTILLPNAHVRNVRAALGFMVLQRKLYNTSSNDLQLSAGIGHVEACSSLYKHWYVTLDAICLQKYCAN